MFLVLKYLSLIKLRLSIFLRFGRVEILSGFVNGVFLVVISFFVFVAAIQRLFDPPTVSTERLLVSKSIFPKLVGNLKILKITFQ